MGKRRNVDVFFVVGSRTLEGDGATRGSLLTPNVIPLSAGVELDE